MRYVMMVFWGVVFGFIIGFIGSALTQTTFILQQSLIVGGVFGLLVGFVPPLLGWSKKLSSK
ncbi:YjzD family protein [Agrilactobacillus yilanensis]|uniref:YjzD family protein n=1 Tax=Agrilactobacillus yilanensis TaxID=2485997 RepID=A0ABW4J5D6_9LACO|nr:YjzD family protein [Agrilactobacillus yilanensis]